MIEQTSPSNIGLWIGITATVVTIIAAVLKMYSENKANIRKQAELEVRVQNAIEQTKKDLLRVEQDIVKVESRLQDGQSTLMKRFASFETKIEGKFDTLQETLIDILKAK